jgi:hypothetical protein
MPILTIRNSLVEKIRSVVIELSELHDYFALFAVIQREDDSSGLWDIVVSATWITDERSFIKEFLTALHPTLTKKELLSISRVVVLDPSEPFVQELADAIRGHNSESDEKNSSLELMDATVNGIPIKHAYLITSSKEEDSHVVLQ